MGISFSVLPYTPNVENMSGVETTDLRGQAANAGESRILAKAELESIFKGSDYLVENITEDENSLCVEIKDVFDVQSPIFIHLKIGKEIMWIDQSDLKPAIEIAILICKTCGPMFFGVNSFNSVFLIDEKTDPESILGEREGQEDDDYLNMLKQYGWPAQRDIFATPGINMEQNKYLMTRKFLCDLVESDLAAAGYKKFSHLFYRRSGDILSMIMISQVHYTSIGTTYVSGQAGVSNIGRLEKEGVQIPEFPDLNFFQKTRRYPTREDFKEWGYANVSSDPVTDLNWLKEQYIDYLKKHVKYFIRISNELCEEVK